MPVCIAWWIESRAEFFKGVFTWFHEHTEVVSVCIGYSYTADYLSLWHKWAVAFINRCECSGQYECWVYYGQCESLTCEWWKWIFANCICRSLSEWQMYSQCEYMRYFGHYECETHVWTIIGHCLNLFSLLFTWIECKFGWNSLCCHYVNKWWVVANSNTRTKRECMWWSIKCYCFSWVTSSNGCIVTFWFSYRPSEHEWNLY